MIRFLGFDIESCIAPSTPKTTTTITTTTTATVTAATTTATSASTPYYSTASATTTISSTTTAGSTAGSSTISTVVTPTTVLVSTVKINSRNNGDEHYEYFNILSFVCGIVVALVVPVFYRKFRVRYRQNTSVVDMDQIDTGVVVTQGSAVAGGEETENNIFYRLA